MIYTAIDTFYLTDEQLKTSPSRKDGVDEKTEGMLRMYGAELIQETGILLKLPQAVMATGQVLFHRFYCKKSFARFNVKRVAASCVWLAAKLEECPKKVREVVSVFHRVDQRREGLPLELIEPLSKQYEEMKTDLIRTERHLLKEMGFICHVEHPHKFLFTYLQQLEVFDEGVKQEAWNLANDSLRTTLCVRFKSEVVACGVIYAAARRARIPLPEDPPWWLVFDAEKWEIDEVCRALAELYKQPKAAYVEVGKDAKSFVLTTRAWDPPPDPQELPGVLKHPANGTTPTPPAAAAVEEAVEVEAPQQPEATAEPPPTVPEQEELSRKEPSKAEDGAGQEAGGEAAGDEKEATKAPRVSGKDAEAPAAIGVAAQGQSSKEVERSKERDGRERGRDRDREREKEGQRESDREHLRGREREREKESRVKERDAHRDRDRGRGSGAGRLDKRHHSTSRDREREPAPSHSGREKDRSYRYHPYDRLNGRGVSK